MHSLNKLVKTGAITVRTVFKSLLFMLKTPGAFLFFKFFIFAETSSTVTMGISGGSLLSKLDDWYH